MGRIDSMVSTTVDVPVEPSLLKQCQEQLSNYQEDLSTLYDDLLAMVIADEDEILILHSKLKNMLFGTSHNYKVIIINDNPC